MSRKSVMDGDSAPLAALLEEVVFCPQEEHRRLKSRFLAKTADNPLIDPDTVSLEEVQRILKSSTIAKYWNQPGFRDWFLNIGEYQERLEGLFSLALDAAEDILMSQDPKGQAARASMVRTMAELAGKLKPKTQEISAADQMKKLVAGMDMAQLSILLGKNGDTLQISASKGTEKAIPAEIVVDKDSEV